MIRVRGLRKEYSGGSPALDGIDLDIGRGEFVALIGPSGAGKSTLLRFLNGLVTPTAGQVEVDGVAVTGLPRRPSAGSARASGSSSSSSTCCAA